MESIAEISPLLSSLDSPVRVKENSLDEDHHTPANQVNSDTGVVGRVRGTLRSTARGTEGCSNSNGWIVADSICNPVPSESRKDHRWEGVSEDLVEWHEWDVGHR